MTIEQKRDIIWKIIGEMKSQSILHNKFFDAGDVFFSLAFKADEELKNIASLLKIA